MSGIIPDLPEHSVLLSRVNHTWELEDVGLSPSFSYMQIHQDKPNVYVLK